ncbi:hypothetical protein RB653_010559 [Dictyostelium firmibasis]|uniref:Uncharacterized protein n=1 Tax=Dictyostelium firmibasis TaxID=79012 RepID=A0AAN7YQ00_9MYCE
MSSVDIFFIIEPTTFGPRITSLEKINIFGFSFLVFFKAIDDYGVKYLHNVSQSNHFITSNWVK